jgi:hypothetical protein
VRSGHSTTFRLFHRAILGGKQVTFTYKGHRREVCPYILGHKDGAEKLLAFGRTSTGWMARNAWTSPSGEAPAPRSSFHIAYASGHAGRLPFQIVLFQEP